MVKTRRSSWPARAWWLLAATVVGCNLALDLPGFEFDGAAGAGGSGGEAAGGGEGGEAGEAGHGGDAGQGGEAGAGGEGKVVGAPCDLGDECLSTFCVDGYCCEESCQGTCEACSDALTSGVGNGTCAPVTTGTDPEMECDPDERCDGAGSCREVAGNPCADGMECLSGHCVDARCCDVICDELCVGCAASKTDAADGTCAPITALTDPDVECLANQRCDGAGACRRVDGAACLVAGDCLSGNCVDDVCCDDACNGTCEACASALTGDLDGSCAPITAQTDPDVECGVGFGCDGSGACFKLDGTACLGGGECISMLCTDGVCCASACAGLCQSCDGADTGGASGSCQPITPFTDPDNECTGVQICNATSMCGLKPSGVACAGPTECISNQCVDSVCCATTCPGTCQACDVVGFEGVCSFIPMGSDPDNECPGMASTCDGSGSCT
jgi:hypothetical protein